MRIEKYGQGNCGLLNEADRSMYEKDTASHSLIRKEDTELNYNLCSHPAYNRNTIAQINKRIRGVKTLRHDANTWFGVIISQPKDFQGTSEEFFKSAYKCMKAYFGLQEEDIVSAYVHMDETTPHMHFYAIPHVYPNEKLAQKIYEKMQTETDAKKILKYERDGVLAKKETVSWERFMPKAKYQCCHRDIQTMMEQDLGKEVHLLNGKTLGYDVQKISKELKQELIDTNKALYKARNDLINAKKELNGLIVSGKQRLAKLNQYKSDAEKALQEVEEDLDELLETLGVKPEKQPELQDAIILLQKTILVRRGEFEQLDEDIKMKKEDISALQTQINNNQKRLDEMNQKFDIVKTEINRFVADKTLTLDEFLDSIKGADMGLYLQLENLKEGLEPLSRDNFKKYIEKKLEINLEEDDYDMER